MKWTGRILFLLLLATAGLMVFLPDKVARWAVGHVARTAGISATFDDIHVGVIKPVVRVHNLVFTNPSGFEYPEMLTVKELYIRYDLSSLAGRQKIIHELRIDIPRIVLVNTSDGRNNFGVVARKIPRTEKDDQTESAGETGPVEISGKKETRQEKAPESGNVSISKLVIRIKDMEVRQYVSGAQDPVIIPVPVNMERTYENVTDLHEVGVAISTELLLRSSAGFFQSLDQLRKKDDNNQSRELIRNIKKLFR